MTSIAKLYAFCSIFIISLLTNVANSNPDKIAIFHIPNMQNESVYLVSIKGELARIIDSTYVSAKGIAVFGMKEEYPFGLYKLGLKNQKSIDFVFNNEDIEITLGDDFEYSSAQVLKSDENILYFNYKKEEEKKKRQIALLQTIIKDYPYKDALYKESVSTYNSIVNSHESQEKTKSLSSLYIKSSQEYLPSIHELLSSNNYQLEHFFDYIDFTDTALIHSNILSSRVIQYITLYNKIYGKTKRTQALYEAVDSILNKAESNDMIFSFVADFLIDGFENMRINEIASHISERYNEKHSCTEGNSKTNLEKKVYANMYLKVGDNAPQLSNIDIDLSADSISVVVFWATWCPHCKQTFPQIVRLIEQSTKQNIRLISISLDEDKDEWRSYISKIPHSNKSKHVCDEKSWDSDDVISYSVYGTPTIFVIQSGKIIGKPIDINELKKNVF